MNPGAPTPLAWRDIEILEADFDLEGAELVHDVEVDGCVMAIFETAVYRWLSFDDLVQSASLVAHPDDLLLNYARNMLGFRLFAPAHARVHLLGLGGGSLARFLARYEPRMRVTAVEYSAAVVDLARTCFGLPAPSDHFDLQIGDAREHLRTARDPADTILIDIADADGTPGWLESRALFADARARLAPNGLLAINVVVDDDGQLPRLLAPLKEAFDGQVVHTDCDPWNNVIVFAFNAGLPPLADPALARRARRLEPRLGTALRRLLASLTLAA